MVGTILDNFDDFNFMVILLFLFFVLMGFIIIIIVNVKNNSKYNMQMQYVQSNQYPQTTVMPQCNPKNTNGQC
jgi:hypothetical protein